MSSTSRNRQPAGQPIGGQFATTARAESNVGLAAAAGATPRTAAAERRYEQAQARLHQANEEAKQAALDFLEVEAAERFPSARTAHIALDQMWDGTIHTRIDHLADEDGNHVVSGDELSVYLSNFEDWYDTAAAFDRVDGGEDPAHGEYTYTLTGPREPAGTATVVDRSKRKSTAMVDEQVRALDGLSRDIDERTFELGRDGTISVVLSKFPDATEVSIWDSDGESCFEVYEIRGPNGVLWSAEDVGWDDEFADKLRDYSLMTDRLGMRHLFQPADDEHDNHWSGFVIR